LVALLACCVLAEDSAAENVWLGTSTDWSMPGNWSTGVVPGPGNSVSITIPGNRTAYPQLRESLVLGSTRLSIGADAELDVQGHTLTIGAGVLDTIDGPDLAYHEKRPSGLVIASGGTLRTTPGATVIVSGPLDARTGGLREPETRRPGALRLPGGIAGDSAVRVRFVLRGTPGTEVRVTYDAQKGGTAAVTTRLR